MRQGCISVDRILDKLDGYLNKNDYDSAERHLLYWLSEAQGGGDARTELLIRNELMGLYRKLGKKQQAIDVAEAAVNKITELNIGNQVGAATTFLNTATVYKAFDMADKALPMFERAKDIYERDLEPTDNRLAGLYNNMALALVDLKEFARADELYEKALSITQSSPKGALETAITYLNMASAAEAELGLIEADEKIAELLEKAEALIEGHENRDGYYAFVCEKCASVFEYYGLFFYGKELKERARRIYEGT